ncbi:MAG: YMGG-like glycine zipper-containing protein [Gammaproteobacteria bacterium]
MRHAIKWSVLGATGGILVLAISGCAQMPTGPTVAVWPAPGKPFSVFRAEDAACRQYAYYDVRGSSDNANNEVAKRAAIGTALGAVAGVLIGDSGRGAGVGAGVGLLAGSASGGAASGQSDLDAQDRYNIAYEQCMYSKGNQIPGAPQPNYAPPPPPPPEG